MVDEFFFITVLSIKFNLAPFIRYKIVSLQFVKYKDLFEGMRLSFMKFRQFLY